MQVLCKFYKKLVHILQAVCLEMVSSENKELESWM